MTLGSDATEKAATNQAEWPLDPTELAVEASRWRRREELPEPFCIELGRRLLLAQLEYSEWILRRVDKVDLERDRSVSRRTTIEFTIRRDAPVFTEPDGTRLRLVPLAVMRRQTMVNLDLRDESGRAVTIPGIRLVQQFDESILLAAAAAADPAAARDPGVRAFIRDAIAGSLDQVRAAFVALNKAPTGTDQNNTWLQQLHGDSLFRATASRLRHNFTLYAFFREDQSQHRLIHMSFDEPTWWLYQKPKLVPPEQGRAYAYETGLPRRISIGRAWAAIGFAATRIRFQTPAAETAASYHFEISAPPGVQIVRATLLAGRPNDAKRHVSLDRIVGHSPIVGLHAVEVPNGSLCRVQVDLRAPSRGWLTTILVGAAAVLGVTASVWWWHWRSADPHWTSEQVTNLVLLLVTTSAAVATLVAQRDSGDVGARFVAGVRAFGTLAITTPVVASGVLAYSALHEPEAPQVNPRLPWIQNSLLALAVLAFVLFFLIFVAWACSVIADGRAVIEESPWDMTRHPERRALPWRRRRRRRQRARLLAAEDDYNVAVKAFRFDSLAVGVRSAEGWHTTYAWTDEKQGNAIDALRDLTSSTRTGVQDGCRSFATRCATVHDCRRVRSDASDRPWAT